MADGMQLTDEDRAATIDSGQSVYVNRVGWEVTYMVQAGAIRRPQPGVAEITERGRQLLSWSWDPSRISIWPSSRSSKTSESEASEAPKAADGELGGAQDAQTGATDPDSTPEEVIIAQTVSTVHGALTGELLDRVMQLTRVAFETLVLRRLGAMKYGASGHIESTATSGDAGIDGVVSQDARPRRIYVQAKRYDRDRTIGRPTMQAFVGALQGQQADRGVFMTTCRFTSEALNYADRVGERIIPIDGEELAALMLKHGVGVQPGYVAMLMKLDEDFFEVL
jgi:restriction system protein